MAVINAGATHVPAADLDVSGSVHVESLVRIGRPRELDDIGVPVGRGDRLAIGGAREEARTANRREIGVRAPLIDLAEEKALARVAQMKLAVVRSKQLLFRLPASQRWRSLASVNSST
jgi:hypothetical protein